MQSPIERLNAVRMRLDIGLDKIEKGAERRIILVAAHGLDIDPATRLGAVTNLVALAQLELFAHTRRHGRLTEAGRQFTAEAVEQARRISEETLAKLTPRETARLIALLDKL